jgi:hypothetical protein
LTYKPEFKEKYKLFFQQLPYILPCKTCGSKMKNSIGQIDDALQSKHTLLNWLLKIRNEIYIEQNRPTKTIKENINEIFSVKYSYSPELHTLISTILSILILLILIFIFKKLH